MPPLPSAIRPSPARGEGPNASPIPERGRAGWGAFTPPADPIREVDAAVRAVLAGLGRGTRRDRAVGIGDVFAERLLALRHAEALPEGTREVRVAPGTVVTPLARDHLKRRAIALRYVSRGEVEAVRPAGEWGFAVTAEAESGAVAAWRRALLDDDWRDLGPDPMGAAHWVADRDDRGALLVTDEGAPAVWAACRVANVRAAAAVDPGSVARAVRQLGANLIVIEPAGKPISLLRQMGQTFRRAGAPRAPAWIDAGGRP